MRVSVEREHWKENERNVFYTYMTDVHSMAIEDGHLLLYNKNKLVAAFPPGQWISVVKDGEDT